MVFGVSVDWTVVRFKGIGGLWCFNKMNRCCIRMGFACFVVYGVSSIGSGLLVYWMILWCFSGLGNQG